MSILTIDDLRRLSKRSPSDLCWHWQGAVVAGIPYMHTYDYDAKEKHTTSGPRAVYYITHQERMRGRVAYRCCWVRDCVNPVHIRAATKVEFGRIISASGRLKGRDPTPNRANQLLAMAARGIIPTPPEVVMAIRSASDEVTGRALAQIHGVTPQTVSRIRRGETHRGVA
jgi:hypothetical protein